MLVKIAVIVVCGLAALSLLVFLVPIFANLFFGVGVTLPFPGSFTRAFPRTAIAMFFIGAPALFLALLVAIALFLRRPALH